MTITNFSAKIIGAMVEMSWDSTENYSFVYADAEMISQRPIGVTTFTTSYIDGAVYQAIDSATAEPIPAALEPMPPKYLRVEWEESSEPDLAQYEVMLNGSAVQFVTAGNPQYVYRTPRLQSGENSIVVIAIDAVGNKLSEVSELTFDIESVPPPVRSSVLSQSGATNITLTLQEPLGWPT